MDRGMLTRRIDRRTQRMLGGREPSLFDRLMGRRTARQRPGEMLSDFRARLRMPRRQPTIAGLPLGTAAAIGAAAMASMVVLPQVIGRSARQMMGARRGAAMSVAEVMTRDVVTAPPSASVRELAQLMRDRNVGTVVITSDGSIHGLVTDRQLVTRCLAKAESPETCRAEDVMTAEMPGPAGLVTAHPSMDILEAARLMGQHHIRRLPVVEHGSVVGIVSVADLAGEVKDMVGALLEEVSKAEK